jgi:hypothetical protein
MYSDDVRSCLVDLEVVHSSTGSDLNNINERNHVKSRDASRTTKAGILSVRWKTILCLSQMHPAQVSEECSLPIKRSKPHPTAPPGIEQASMIVNT